VSSKGYEPVWTPPLGERIVSMLEFGGRIVIATDRGIYQSFDGQAFEPVWFLPAADA
jgi:hypothetical protein